MFWTKSGGDGSHWRPHSKFWGGRVPPRDLRPWLHDEFDFTSTAMSWLTTYTKDRDRYVKVGQQSSSIVLITSGVPLGSVLGPILFAAYTSTVGDIIKRHFVRYHQYADDTHLHIAMWTVNTDTGLSILSDCTMDVKHWYLSNGLQLNADKSEVILVGTGYQLQAASAIKSVRVRCGYRHTWWRRMRIVNLRGGGNKIWCQGGDFSFFFYYLLNRRNCRPNANNYFWHCKKMLKSHPDIKL